MPSTNSLHEPSRTENLKQDLIYPDLSYAVVGALFEVNKQLGFGYKEKVYQEAIAEELSKRRVPFKRENFSRINYKGKKIGALFHDFIVDGKVILEIKVGNELYESHLKQILSYLRDKNIKLGILAVFTPRGVIYKRVVN